MLLAPITAPDDAARARSRRSSRSSTSSSLPRSQATACSISDAAIAGRPVRDRSPLRPGCSARSSPFHSSSPSSTTPTSTTCCRSLYGLTVGPAFLAMALSLAAAMLASGPWPALGALPSPPGCSLPRQSRVLPISSRDRRQASSAPSRPLVAGARSARRSSAWQPACVPTLIWRQRRARGDSSISHGQPDLERFQRTAWPNVREFFYSNRLLQWLPVAGAIGMFRAAPSGRGIDGRLGRGRDRRRRSPLPRRSRGADSSSTSFRPGRPTRCSWPRYLRSFRRWWRGSETGS